LSGFARPLNKRGASGPRAAPARGFGRRPSFGFEPARTAADAPQPWSFLKPQWHSPSPGWGKRLQAKLVVGKVDDPLEQEADRVAEAVLRPPTSAPPDASPLTPPGGSPPASPGSPPGPSSGAPTVQRKCGACDGSGAAPCDACSKQDDDTHEHAVQRAPAPSAAAGPDAGGGGVEPAVNAVLDRAGAPLDEETRGFFEPRFATDFSDVRVHTGADAADATARLGALAFTAGARIAFAPGAFAPSTSGGRRLIAHELTHVVQQRSGAGQATMRVQRAMADADSANDTRPSEGDAALPQASDPTSKPASEQAPVAAGQGGPDAGKQPAPAAASAGALLIDDTATAGPGQMGVGPFLDQVEGRIREAISANVKDSGCSDEGCPYIATALAFFRGQSATYVERALKKYLNGASVSTASDYVPLVAERVARGAREWAKTGKLTEVPAELAPMVPGPVRKDVVQKKAVGAGSGAHVDAAAVQTRLGGGAPLEGSVRARMEGAFGRDFSHVRVHTGTHAGALTSELASRAFTVGSHVAFAPGEFHPGTPVGDALLAHELAHVVQQRDGAAAGPAAKADGPTSTSALEHDADNVAVGAVLSLWGRARGAMARFARNLSMPQLKTGLRLQSCGRGTCPEGFAWRVVTRINAVVGCDCLWRCSPIPESGPAISDPNAPGKTLLFPPDDIQWPGALGAAAGEIATANCTCLPPPPDRARGTILNDRGGAPDIDPSIFGKLPGHAGPAAAQGSMPETPVPEVPPPEIGEPPGERPPPKTVAPPAAGPAAEPKTTEPPTSEGASPNAAPLDVTTPDEFSVQGKLPGDPKAFVRVEPGTDVFKVTDIFRGGQPKGSGGDLLAQVLGKANFKSGNTLQIGPIENAPTQATFKAGGDPAGSVLGKTAKNALDRLGITPASFQFQIVRGKLTLVIVTK